MTESKSTNITWHDQKIAKKDLETLHRHKGVTVWFTGLSGSGKSTIANAVSMRLYERGVTVFVLDGDNVRHGLNKDLGFTAADRVENIRRIGEVAKLFTSAAIINLTAFISPYTSDRQLARDLQPDTFIEVYCNASLDICEGRDPKGIYKKARAGIIKNFTGIDDPYEPPAAPEVEVPSGTESIGECAERVVSYLQEKGFIP
jgi:adenylylsulfate kinase